MIKLNHTVTRLALNVECVMAKSKARLFADLLGINSIIDQDINSANYGKLTVSDGAKGQKCGHILQ